MQPRNGDELMDTLPHNSERARLPSIRRSEERIESGKIVSSKGTPVVGETVSVFRHTVELIGPIPLLPAP